MVEHGKSSPLPETHTPIAYATSVEYQAPVASAQDEWACPQCTLLNPMTAEFCGACMMQKTTIAHPEQEPGISMQHEEPFLQNPMQSNIFIPATAHEIIPERNIRDVPSSYTEDVSEDPLQKKRRRRRRRRVRMVIGGIGGLTLGAIIFAGPVGIVVGAIAGTAGTRYITKRRERTKDARLAAGNP
jgi:hypothetical protein